MASRRSGSTWLMEILAAEPGVTFVNEPFHPSMLNGGGLTTGLESVLPQPECKVVGVPRGLESEYHAHVTDFDSTRIRGPYNPLSPHFEYAARKRVLKVVHATAISDWMVEELPRYRYVYLIRHPIPSALSLERNCLPRARAHLLSPAFRDRFLTPELQELTRRILDEGTVIERWVLEWCLDNIVPWRTFVGHQDRGLVVSYEELLLNPAGTVQRIAEFAEIPLSQRGEEQVDRLSASAENKKRRMDPKSRLDQLGHWRESVDSDVEERVFRIVQEFGIDAYEAGRLLPRDEYLLSPARPPGQTTSVDALRDSAEAEGAPSRNGRLIEVQRRTRGCNRWIRGRVRNSWHWKIREVLGRSSLFLSAARWKYRGEPPPDQWATTHVLGPDSELLIEGFPRSGNTFAVVAFQFAQPRHVRVANHLHAPAHVRAAVEQGVPTVILIRNPDQAVTSFTIFTDFAVDLRGALEAYISFYEQIDGWAHGFVTATFDTVTEDFGGVIRAINERFGTRFTPFDNSPESTRLCFERIEAENARMHGGQTREQGIARPSEKRSRMKAELRTRLDHPALADLRARAWELYDHFRTRETEGAG